MNVIIIFLLLQTRMVGLRKKGRGYMKKGHIKWTIGKKIVKESNNN